MLRKCYYIVAVDGKGHAIWIRTIAFNFQCEGGIVPGIFLSEEDAIAWMEKEYMTLGQALHTPLRATNTGSKSVIFIGYEIRPIYTKNIM